MPHFPEPPLLSSSNRQIADRLDHDLALRLAHSDALSEAQRATCYLVALSAVYGEPVEPRTADAFAAILRTTAAS